MVLLMVAEPMPDAPVVWDLVDNVLCVSFSIGLLVYGAHPHLLPFSSRKLVCIEWKNKQVQRDPGSEAGRQQTTEHRARGAVFFPCPFRVPLLRMMSGVLGANMKLAIALEELCLFLLLGLNSLVSVWKEGSCMGTL